MMMMIFFFFIITIINVDICSRFGFRAQCSRVGKVVVTGLTPRTKYNYFFRTLGPNPDVSEIASFKTLPEPDVDSFCEPLMFLHISCANEPPYPVSNTLEIESENANFLLFNGDTVYADAFWLEIESQANLFDPQDG